MRDTTYDRVINYYIHMKCGGFYWEIGQERDSIRNQSTFGV